MTTNKDPAATYTASVNPPRRAKRARSEVDTTGPPVSATAPQHRLRPQLLPKESQLAGRTDNSPYHDSTDDEDDYDPVTTAPPPKRRGRKPGPMSRSARESQRKLNHSRIEKARRTKINETLATLSSIVNEAEKQRAAANPSMAVAEPEGKDKGEKEFKLDVLVKTVTYIQELVQKVKTLEARSCSKCSGDLTTSTVATAGVKRKRSSEDPEDVDVGEMHPPAHPQDTSDASPRITSSSPRAISSRAPSRQPGQSPCLPPISAWLPHPYIDPSALNENGLPPSANQLPTPPLSGSFRTPLAFPPQVLPALSLPGPAHPMLSQPPSPAQRISMSSASARRASYSGSARSPTVSPSWTPEDETAASLLLQMSSSPASSVSGSSIPASTPKMHAKSLETARAMSRRLSQTRPMHAETPSSLLGLGRDG